MKGGFCHHANRWLRWFEIDVVIGVVTEFSSGAITHRYAWETLSGGNLIDINPYNQPHEHTY